MTLPINHVENWRHIRHQKQGQIEKYVIREKYTRIDHYFNIGDKIMVIKNQAYKYETPFKVPYGIFQTWTNGTVTIRTGTVTAQLNIRHIKTFNSPEIE